MREQVFADGISSIAILAGTVRLDLFSYSATEADTGGQPKTVPQQRIIMTVPAFLNAAQKIQEAVQAVEKIRSAPAMENTAKTHGAEAKTVSTPQKPPFP